jgi:tetratricopeptide (TPR) repeat protein
VTRPRSFIPLLVVLLATTLALGRLTTASFLNWDDPSTLYQNPHLNPPTLAGLRHFWTHEQGHLYVPVTYTVWWLAALLSRDPTSATLNPHVFHTLNLLIHLGSTTLVFLLLRRFFRNPTAAAIGAAVFALHPVQVETVAWASGTKDLLAGFFSFAALFTLFRSIPTPARDADRATDTHNPPLPAVPLKTALLSTLFFVLALLSKPSAVMLPFVAGALLGWQTRAGLRRPAPYLLPLVWLLLCIPVVLLGKSVQSASLAPFTVPLYARPAIAADALTFYLRKLLFPTALAVDYGRSPLYALTHRPLGIAATVALLITGALILGRRSVPSLTLAGALLLLCTFPVLGLVPFDFQDYSTVADHYLYVALLGPAIAIAAWVAVQPRAARLATIGLFLLALLTFRQAGFWSDTVTLFAHNLDVNPRSGMSHLNSAIALTDANRPADAEAHYRAALRLDFTNASAHLGLGKLLAMTGQPDRALAHLDAAVRLAPDNPVAHFNRAVLLSDLDRPTAAIADYRAALRLNDDYADAHINLATLLLFSGDPSGAIDHFQRALRLRPSLPRARQGLDLAQQVLANPQLLQNEAPRPATTRP